MPGAPSVHGPHPVNLMAESFISHALWTASFTHAFCCVNPDCSQQTGMLPGSGHRVLVATKSVSRRPPLAFAVTVEGNPGEGGLSGGGTAAPVIAKVLRDIEARPAVHAVSFTPGKVVEETDPLTAEPMQDLVLNPRPASVPSRENPVRGFFSRFFR